MSSFTNERLPLQIWHSQIQPQTLNRLPLLSCSIARSFRCRLIAMSVRRYVLTIHPSGETFFSISGHFKRHAEGHTGNSMSVISRRPNCVLHDQGQGGWTSGTFNRRLFSGGFRYSAIAWDLFEGLLRSEGDCCENAPRCRRQVCQLDVANGGVSRGSDPSSFCRFSENSV